MAANSLIVVVLVSLLSLSTYCVRCHPLLQVLDVAASGRLMQSSGYNLLKPCIHGYDVISALSKSLI